MIFGMPTLIQLHSVEENAALAKRLHLQFIELNMNLPYCTPDALKRADLMNISKEFGIHFSFHADENLFICDFNPRIADAHLNTMLEAIDFSLSNQIPLINFHMSPGVYFTLPDGKRYLFEEYRCHYIQRIIRFRDACEKAARGKVFLCIENTGLSQPFIREGMEILLASPIFQLTWDIGHDYSAGNIDHPFIMQHLDRLFHMHIHGAIGKKNHLPLTESHLNWRETLKIGRPHRAVIEVKTPQFLMESVEALEAFTGGI